jgi:WD40 repeat protein
MTRKSNVSIVLSSACSLIFMLPSYANMLAVGVAEVRGDVAYVEGSGAGRKQEIYWYVQGEYVFVTNANPKGRFSFEGELPAGCPPDNCVGMLRAGTVGLTVPLDYQPVEPVRELTLEASYTDAHAGSPVRAVGFFPDSTVVSGGEDARLRSWTVVSSSLVSSLEQQLDHTVYDLAVSAHRPILITGEGGWNGSANSPTLRVLDASGSIPFATQAPTGYVYSVALSSIPENSTLPYPEWTVASGFYGEIAVYQTENLELYATKATKKKRTKALEFSSDGRMLASTSTSGRIQVWSFPQPCNPGDCELDLRLSLSHSGSWYFPIDFAPNSTVALAKIVSGTDGGTIKLWTIEDMVTTDVRSAESGAVYALDWSPDGAMIVAAGGGEITVYDSADLSILFRNSEAHRGRVNDVAFYVDPVNDIRWIVSGGADGDLKLWSIPAPAH